MARVFFTNHNDVVFSVSIGVGGCLCPVSLTFVCAGIAFRELIYIAPIYTSAVEVISFLMICAIFKTAPLFSGFATLSNMKKFPTDLILTLVLVR